MDLIEKSDININRHPWELSRFDCLSKEVRKYHKKGQILDIGCGDSFFDKKLLETNIRISKIYGVDIFLDKDTSISGNHYVVNSYDKLKSKKFDTILMLDVLEHIEDDKMFLEKTVSSLLKKEGTVIITVPAFQFLYSEHDKFLKHFRRYNIKMIRNLCKETNYKIVNYHYFYFSLFLFRLLFRNTANDAGNWKYTEKSFVTRFYRTILNIDYAICKLLNRIFVGLSLCVILKKED